jgi:hypothetical protein
MSFDAAQYPENWRAIRAAILQRAGHCCEGSPAYPDCRAANHRPHPVTGSRVALTIAPLHGYEKSDGRPEVLQAMCNRCHLFYDLPQHIEKRRETLRRRRERVQPVLVFGDTDD